MMRKVIFGGASSLDNFFARPDGSVDWLVWDDEVSRIMANFWPRIDCIVMGRKTYEVSLAMTSGDEAKNPYGNIRTIVFSRTLEAGSASGVEIVNEDAGEFVRELKQQGGKDICILGGGDLASSLFEAGVIDEVGMNIQPVLLGAGIPAFYPMDRQVDLELIECRSLKSGSVYVTYRVKH
jgi:dihydrofolate reductase